MEINREIKNITSAFVLEDNLTECVPYGSGHINDTYRLTYGTGKHYILQKMNRSIFTKPVELMENVSGVTAWLKKKDPGKRWRCGERDSESCDDKGWTSLLCR